MNDPSSALIDLKKSIQFRLKSFNLMATDNAIPGELDATELHELSGRISELKIMLKWIAARQRNLAAETDSPQERFHVVTKTEPDFSSRDKRHECIGNDHDWLLLCYKSDIAMAICNNCAYLEGGWVSYD